MNNTYQDSKTAQNYLNFLTSTNGQLQQNFLWESIKKYLPEQKNTKILDAACGSGWLTSKLKNLQYEIEAFDISESLISEAKNTVPNVNFKVWNLNQSLPYFKNYFDCVILNMAGPDLENLEIAFLHLNQILKTEGVFIMTLPNPKYTYPTAVWKRSLLDFLLFRKPKLKIVSSAEKELKNISREFKKGQTILSNFYPTDTYLKTAENLGLKLQTLEEINSLKDSPDFDLQYQLFRYPLLLTLVFKKS